MPTAPGRKGEALVSHPKFRTLWNQLTVGQTGHSGLCVCVCVCVCACAIAQSCMTLHHPIDCSPPVSPIHGTSQARILQWFAISSSRGSSRPRDQNRICCLAGRFFTMGRNFKAHRGFLTSLTKWTSAKLDYCLRIWTCLCSSKSNANCLVPVALCPTLPSISASLRHRA